MAELGTRIKEELQKQHMSQKELCEKTGIKESVMSKYINNNEDLRTDVLLKISQALNVNIYQLLGEAETEKDAYQICKDALYARGENELTDQQKKELIDLILG